MRRLMLAVCALAIPMSLAAVGLGGSAGASPPVSCTKVTGTATGNITLKGCSAGLGKGSAPASTLLVTGSGTITWKGKHKGTTTVSVTVTTPVTSACKTGSTEYDATGTVTADTSGKVVVSSTVSDKACVSGTGKVSLVKHTVFTL